MKHPRLRRRCCHCRKLQPAFGKPVRQLTRQNLSPPMTMPQPAIAIHRTFHSILIDSCHFTIPKMNTTYATRSLQRICLRQSPISQTCRQQLRHCSTRPSAALPTLLRSSTTPLTRFQFHQRRCESTAKPLTDRPEAAPKAEPREDVPSYEMTFTCKACSTRSSHRMSKQGYHHGTILITCPGCKNRHLIADHLKVSF